MAKNQNKCTHCPFTGTSEEVNHHQLLCKVKGKKKQQDDKIKCCSCDFWGTITEIDQHVLTCSKLRKSLADENLMKFNSNEKGRGSSSSSKHVNKEWDHDLNNFIEMFNPSNDSKKEFDEKFESDLKEVIHMFTPGVSMKLDETKQQETVGEGWLELRDPPSYHHKDPVKKYKSFEEDLKRIYATMKPSTIPDSQVKWVEGDEHPPSCTTSSPEETPSTDRFEQWKELQYSPGSGIGSRNWDYEGIYPLDTSNWDYKSIYPLLFGKKDNKKIKKPDADDKSKKK